MSQYEEFIIDRREKYFQDSARFRNDENDFSARYARGEEIQKDMRRRLIAGTNWKRIEIKAAHEKRRVLYAEFGTRA